MPDPVCEGFLKAFCSIPLVCMSSLMLVPHCFGYGSFVVSFEIRSVSPPTQFSFKIVLASYSLRFHTNFRMDFLFVQKTPLNF